MDHGYWQGFQNCSELFYRSWHKAQRDRQTSSSPPSSSQVQWAVPWGIHAPFPNLVTSHQPKFKILNSWEFRAKSVQSNVKSQAKCSHFNFWCGINISQFQSQDPKSAKCDCSSAAHYKNTTSRRKKSHETLFNAISKHWKMTAVCSRDVAERWYELVNWSIQVHPPSLSRVVTLRSVISSVCCAWFPSCKTQNTFLSHRRKQGLKNH